MSSLSKKESLALHLGIALRKLGKVDQQKRLYVAWKEVFGTSDDEQVLEGVKLVATSLRTLRGQVQDCPFISSAEEVYIPYIKEWQKLVSPAQMQAQMKQFSETLSKDRVNNLFTLNDTLRWYYPQRVLRPSSIDRIKREIDELTEQVRASDLKSDLKHFILAQLSTISWAITNIDFFGVEGVYEVLGAVMARSRAEFLKHEQGEAARAQELVEQPAQRLWRLLDWAIHLNRARTAFEQFAAWFGGTPPSLPPPGA